MKISQYVFLLFLLLPSTLFAQEKFDFYLSNKGNDINPGTSTLLPKKTIAGIAPLLTRISATNGKAKIALKSGDIFEEGLVTSYPIDISTYINDAGQHDFAVLNGSKEFGTGWINEVGTINTFKQVIPYTGFVGYGINGIGGYSFIYVFEIDRVLEKTAPYTARRMLQFVSSPAAVESTNGSFYIPTGNENPMPVFIHTSDGSSPNLNKKFRYEVCVKDWAINSAYQENNHFENLWVRGFGAGNGLLPGGANSYYNKIVFGPGAAIHHLVVRSGVIDHSLFLPGPKNTNSFAVVFYDVEGFGRHCIIRNTMFLDINSPVYAHISEGRNYGAVEMDNVVGFADSIGGGSFMYTSNTDTVLLNRIYTAGFYSGYHYGNAKYAGISNSSFKDVTIGIAYNSGYNPISSSIKNVFIKNRGTEYLYGIIMPIQGSLVLNNSIIHLVNDKASGRDIVGSFIAGSGGNENKIAAAGNIFICDVMASKSVIAATTSIAGGPGKSADNWDNNVYILLKGKGINWQAIDKNGSIVWIRDFEEWKNQSGQDKNSLFFDLRYDTRGLKAIFTDPANGNYDLANTKEGRQIAALKAGMTDPLTCFLHKPTYEEAAALVNNNMILSVNACRNPCLQNTIRVNNTFNAVATSDRHTRLQWDISEQQNIDHYELQRATEFSVFKTISSQPVTADSLYSFIDDVQVGIIYRYRLLIAAKAGGICYSGINAIKISDNKLFSIYPNPSTGKILVSLNGYAGGGDLSVLNSMGQTVMKMEGLSLYRSFQLNLAGRPKGIYFLKLKNSEGISTQKFVVQ